MGGTWAVRLRFRLRSGSAGLFEDKKRCGMVEEDRCVLCNGGNVEDVKHFVLECEEFDQDIDVGFWKGSRELWEQRRGRRDMKKVMMTVE